MKFPRWLFLYLPTILFAIAALIEANFAMGGCEGVAWFLAGFYAAMAGASAIHSQMLVNSTRQQLLIDAQGQTIMRLMDQLMELSATSPQA